MPTTRIIGTSTMNITGSDVRRELEEEIASIGCFSCKKGIKSLSSEFLASIDSMDLASSGVETRIKECVERNLLRLNDMEEQATLLIRAHELRKVGDTKGCWRLLQTYDDAKLRVQSDSEIVSMQRCVKALEDLEALVTEQKKKNNARKVPLGSAHAKLERAKKYVSEDADTKLLSAAKLTQLILAVVSGTTNVKSIVSECFAKTNGNVADMAEEICKADVLETINASQTASAKILRRERKNNAGTLVVLVATFFLLFALLLSLSPTKSSPRRRIGVVCSVKDPINLESWASHHRRIGVDVFYVYIDETSGKDVAAREQCRKAGIRPFTYDLEWAALQNGKDVDPGWDQPTTLVFKQRAVVNDALARASKEGLEWLFHLDSDELLGVRNNDLRGALGTVPRKHETIYFENLELIPETESSPDCLKDGSLFRADPRRFLHYANGKPAARVVPGVRFGGPHRFVSASGSEYRMPQEQMVVYHYVSCTLEEMEKKIRDMGRFRAFFGEVPFHRRNMEAADVCARASRKECEESVRARFGERIARAPGEKLVRVRPYAGDLTTS